MVNDDDVDEDQGAALFTLDELVALDDGRPPGRVEAALAKAVAAGQAAGTLVAEDLGLIGSALVGAKALDRAELLPPGKSVYAVAQLLTPYRETLAALRLPAAVTPADGPRPPAAGGEVGADLLRDLFGTAESPGG